MNARTEIEVTALVARKIDAASVKCCTMIVADGVVNRGDARLLKAGAPTLLRWIGKGLRYALLAATVLAGGFFGWIFLSELFEQGLWHGLSVIGVLLGLLAVEALAIWVLKLVAERQRWPDYLR